jgi:hypothetical protein
VGNYVLDSLLTERAQQISTIDSILAEVEGRDLTDAERGLLERARERIGDIDKQIEPLEKFEALRGTHADTARQIGMGGRPDLLPAEPRRIDGANGRAAHRTPGAFLVDYLRAYGITDRGRPDEQAAARLAQTRAVADQKTTDTPGILPTPIVGTVVNLIDANRPFVSSLGGAKALGGIPGATFTRPKITQHVLVGQQVPAGGAGEKTQLPSQKMTVSPVSFAKATYGGTVDISRQDIDWSSPTSTPCRPRRRRRAPSRRRPRRRRSWWRRTT